MLLHKRDLCSTVRAVRRAHGISRRELARKTQLPSSFMALSEETPTLHPKRAALLLGAMNCKLYELFEVAQEEV